jgi:hypothetical protein
VFTVVSTSLPHRHFELTSRLTLRTGSITQVVECLPSPKFKSQYHHHHQKKKKKDDSPDIDLILSILSTLASVRKTTTYSASVCSPLPHSGLTILLRLCHPLIFFFLFSICKCFLFLFLQLSPFLGSLVREHSDNKTGFVGLGRPELRSDLDIYRLWNLGKFIYSSVHQFTHLFNKNNDTCLLKEHCVASMRSSVPKSTRHRFKLNLSNQAYDFPPEQIFLPFVTPSLLASFGATSNQDLLINDNNSPVESVSPALFHAQVLSSWSSIHLVLLFFKNFFSPSLLPS